MGGLVEAEQLFDVAHDSGVEAARAAIGADRPAFPTGRGAGAGPAGLARLPAALAGQPPERLPLAAQLGEHLLDRAAGGELHDGEVDEDDAEQGRDDQQQAPKDVGGHGFPSRLQGGAAPLHPLPGGLASWTSIR
jgi:hypothetical protein